MRYAPTFAALLGALLPLAGGARPVAADHVRVELIAERNALVPGRRNWLGLRLTHEPHWHTYWINPGDSGLPTKLRWQLPPGFAAGDIAWPAPRRFESGGLANFGYDGRALLLVPVDVPADARAGTTVTLAAEAKWLVCREECIPGKAALKLSLPVAKAAAPYPRWQRTFAAARAHLPSPASWSGSVRVEDAHVRVVLGGANLPSAGRIDAFAVQPNVVANAAPRTWRDGDALHLDFARSEYFTTPPTSLDLVVVDGSHPGAAAHAITVPLSAAAPTH